MAAPKPWVKYESLPENGGRFVISPLKRGMGTTVGNALRRVLLSSLSGYSVTAVKIDGVKHEFSAIPNVVEDVFDVISNLKSIVFSSDDDDEKVISFSTNKSGVFTAGDFLLPAGIQIINPAVPIATITGNGLFKIDVFLKRGVGYDSAESNRSDDQAIDTINVDASYSPVLKVNHHVDNIRVGKELDYDSLVLDVWTDGSVTSEDTVQDAAEILLSHFSLFGRLNERPELEVLKPKEAPVEKSKESALSLNIDDLELSARSSNCLKRAGIDTVAELIEKDLSELIQIKNFGKKSADEINEKLSQFGLSLKGTFAL